MGIRYGTWNTELFRQNLFCLFRIVHCKLQILPARRVNLFRITFFHQYAIA